MSAGQLFASFIGLVVVGIVALAVMSVAGDGQVPATAPSPAASAPVTSPSNSHGDAISWVERRVARNSRERVKQRTQSAQPLPGPASAPVTTPIPATEAQLRALQPFLGTWQAQFAAYSMTMRFCDDGGYPTCEAITQGSNADIDIDVPLSDYAVAGNVLTWRGARFELRSGGAILHATYPPNQAGMTELDWTRL